MKRLLLRHESILAILTVLAQKKLVSGLSSGAIKG